jgi:hypothetical protein
LHPEDTVSEEDLEIVTLENVLTNGIYNDLGFVAKDSLIILVEAQTTWSINIIVRMFLYLAATYQQHIYANDELRMSIYGIERIKLPLPELYVIYTGEQGDKSDVLSLKDDIFMEMENCIDVCAKVIYSDESRRDIIGQYIAFCVILKKQMKECNGDKQKAIKETIRICIENGNLAEYLSVHQKEVEDYMFTMLSQEQIEKDMVDAAIIKTRAEDVKSLLNNNVPEQTIATSFGLSIEQVRKMASQQ